MKLVFKNNDHKNITACLLPSINFPIREPSTEMANQGKDKLHPQASC